MCFVIPMFYVYMLWIFYVRFTYPYHEYGTWSTFNFLHISQWTTLPTQSCLVLNSFCANWQHLLIIWSLIIIIIIIITISRIISSLNKSHLSLSECESSQITSTLLVFLADHNKFPVWIMSTFCLISNSSSPSFKRVRQWPRKPRFNPRSSHSKDSKNGT